MPTGTELATAWVHLVPSAEGIEGGIGKALAPAEKEAEAAGKRSGSRFSAGVKGAIAVGGIAAAARGIAEVFQTGMEEIKFGETISAQTDLLIKNTGAGFSTKWVEDYTLGLSQVSGISEEELQAAGNNVIKFGDVSEENYKRAVDSLNDLGGAGKDVAGSSEALGKALADPAKAAALLKRQGILLNDEQKALITTFTEAGDKAGAQGVILDALESTYGGMAEAAGATAQGGLNKLQNTWENLAGTAVEALMPAINGIVQGLSGFFTFLQENQQFIPIIAIAIGTILVAAFIAWTASIWAANAALLANPITWIILAIIALIAGIILLVMNWDTVWAAIMAITKVVVDWLVAAFNSFMEWWNNLWTGVWEFLVAIWKFGVAFVMGYFQFLFDTLIGIGTAIVDWWTGLWNGIVQFFKDAWNGMVLTFAVIRQAFSDAFDGLGKIVQGAFEGVVGFVKSYINTIIDLINGIIGGINGVAGAIGAAIGLELKIPLIPHLAGGGTLTRSGAVVVGEDGPELLRLPRGASVDPNIERDEDFGARYQNIQHITARADQDEKQIADYADNKAAFRLRTA